MHFRPEIIESLTALWVALPLKAPQGEDESDPAARQFAITDAYCRVLRDISPEAVRNVVDALCEGRIKEASKRFCPTVPELAGYAREEQNRLDAINRPKMVSYQPVSQTWKDWRIMQRERTRELAREGFVLIAENVTIDHAVSMARARRWPVGTIWFWAISEAWGVQS